MGFEALGKKLAQLGVDTKNGVQKMNENYQLSSKLNDEKKALEQLYAQIGAAVVKKYADTPLEGFEDQFAAVAQAKEVIEGLEEQVQKGKGIVACPECGKVAAKGETVCSGCGAQLPEVEDLGEKFKQDAKEAGNEVGELVNDAAEKAKVLFAGLAEKADAFVQGVRSRNSEEAAKEAEEVVEEAVAEEAAAQEEALEDAIEEEIAAEAVVAEEAVAEEVAEEAVAEEAAEEAAAEEAAEETCCCEAEAKEEE